MISALAHAQRGLVGSARTLEQAATRTVEASAPREVEDRVSLSGDAPLVDAAVDRVSSQASFRANLKVVQTAEDMIAELLKPR